MRFTLASSPDLSYNQPVLLLWACVSQPQVHNYSLTVDHSMAELSIGVMVTCFPTLPGIMQRRRKKASASIVNGSARSHRVKPSPYDASVDGDYFELREGPRPGPRVRMPQNAITNDISGGTEIGDSIFERGITRDHFTMPHGILKITRIEQSNV